jgi:DNA mismatch repair protein MutS2
MTDSAASPPFATAASFASLEFPSLLRLVAGFAATDLGQEAILELAPMVDEPSWHRRRRQMEEMERLLENGSVVPSWEEPLRPLLVTATGAADDLGGAGLLALARLVRWVADTADRLRDEANPTPELAHEIPDLPSLQALAQRVAATLDERGRVRDDATPRLGELGHRVRRLRRGLYADLESCLRETPDAFSETTVTLHEGRLVLLLQAGARGRVQGLVHGRSGTGQSFYFEPLQSVESNNRFREAVDEEDEERRRVLRELFDTVGEAGAELEAISRWLTHLDVLQSACRYGEQMEGRLADLADQAEVQLVDVTHPLLDPRLRRARERALGQAGHAGDVVPLNLEISPQSRMLIITGPNAGGKTVALKTLGLSALAHQTGLPIPAAAGTRLPLFRHVVARVGDEQDLLTDLSTFSGRLLRLGEAWRSAGSESLVLLDELGSGTDPEEGAALAIALAEELLARGAITVITTHLIRLAMDALDREGARCGAMEFDSSTGEPTFHLVLGPPGGSEAIALARRLELPERWLHRAEEMVDSSYRSLLDTIKAVESERQKLISIRKQVEQKGERLAVSVRRAAAEEERLAAERQRLGRKLRAEMDTFRQEVRQRLDRELESLRQQASAEEKASVPRRSAEKLTSRLFADAPKAPAEPQFEGELEIGMAVRHRGMGWEGVLEHLDGRRATVQSGSKRLKLSADELVPVAEATSAREPARRTGSRLEIPDVPAVEDELNLIGQRVEPALEALESYVDRALLAGRPTVRIVHGHGTGRLRAAIREWLKGFPGVDGFAAAPEKEGGDGATIVNLRE